MMKTIVKKIDENNIELEYAPVRAKTICPALILAASRKDSVKGRTIVLKVSITTRKGFNQLGACPGKRRAINTIGELMKEE